ALARAVELDPALVAAHVNLATAYMDQHDFAKAQEHLEIAVRLAPDDTDLAAELRNLCERRGQFVLSSHKPSD
ncbi:MAG: tetratricopeptide repeat protein, partial [Lyngbya sp.]|nr:tetratricopeptide repeat protein [Lyngbya sp.]